MWGVNVARVAKLRFAEGMTANRIQTVVRPLERLAVAGSFALGCVGPEHPTIRSILAPSSHFLLLTMRVIGPLMQMAKLVQQYDKARLAVGFVAGRSNQPAGARGPAATPHPTFTLVNVKQLRQQIASLEAQITLIEAELADRPLAFPNSSDKDFTNYGALQKAPYDQRSSQ
jgi:hypothetical protein